MMRAGLCSWKSASHRLLVEANLEGWVARFKTSDRYQLWALNNPITGGIIFSGIRKWRSLMQDHLRDWCTTIFSCFLPFSVVFLHTPHLLLIN
ncbi:hypothetical protein MWL72_00550 [Escherichia coli]|nr:hypothetical protein [Escherichia coli]